MADVRRATREDAIPLADFLMMNLWGSYRHVLPRISVRRVFTGLADVLDGGAAYVAEGDGRIVGAIGACETTPWFSDEAMLSEVFYYVRPEARASRVATLLLKALKAEAAERGVRLQCTVNSGEDVDRKDKFYERNGFRRVGGVYNMEARHG